MLHQDRVRTESGYQPKEGSMKTFWSFRRIDFATTIFGIFLLAVTAGCLHINTTCGTCCAKDGNGKDTGCNPSPQNGDYTGPAQGFWLTTDPTHQYQGAGNCAAGSKKCAIPSGRCADGTQCKPWVNPNTMACKCDCNP